MWLNKINVLLKFFSISLIAGVILLAITWSQENASNNTVAGNSENRHENEKCLKCHGKSHYDLTDSISGKSIRKRMFKIIKPDLFYSANHKSFKCIDCHSDEFNTFPHPLKLRFEETSTCLDCHGGDEKYSKYQFEKINEQFEKSVHSTKHSKEFTCWMCHDPHFYKINASNQKEDIEKIIAYDNSICLSCHADIDKYQMILDKENPNIIQKHEWLPNQANHFRKVRCIECHTEVNKNTLVAHKILPKEKAVKRCVECHSSNSILLQTLYKYKSKERLNNGGFFNAVILNDAYVVGANRNYYLNLISIFIFAISLTGIAIHTVLRLFTRNKSSV